MSIYCPHTTNPLQLRSLCKRCQVLQNLNIEVYPMPWGDWGCSAEFSTLKLPLCNGVMSDGFKSRYGAEEWAIKQAKAEGKNNAIKS